MRTIGVVTVARSDYGIYLPLLRLIQKDPGLKLHLIVAGMHWIPEFGSTAKEIEKDGFIIGERVALPLNLDTPEGVATSIGAAVSGYAQCYARKRPDILVVLGDRFEMHAAALGALPFKIPLAHIHGGELTQGAIDDALRHGITKMAHLHFTATEEYAARVKQMGEESWRVVPAGAPALDKIRTMKLLDKKELEKQFGLDLKVPPLLATYHPVTLQYEQTEWQVAEWLKALESFDLPIIFTSPNADTSNRIVRQMIEAFVKTDSRATWVSDFGPIGYFSMMARSRAMVGNSSSGLIEAPSFELPVVNIGIRQEGRVRAQNVIDVGYSFEEIRKGIQKAISPEFKLGLKGMKNPYGNGNASEKIVKVLKEIDLDQKLILKKFLDISDIHGRY